MSDKIKKFFEFYIPVTCCNLKCEYCYISQFGWQKGRMPKFKHTAKEIGLAFTKKRLGGTCFFSLCGGGETLLPPEMPEIVKELLAQGHYVNVTSNATFSKAFDEIVKIIPRGDLARLHFVFSLHYLELKRLGLLDRYVENVLKVRAAGCSYEIKFNLYDGYLQCIDEIKEFCIRHFGALPQVGVTRKEGDPVEYLTSLTAEEYERIGNSFKSPTFDLHCKNFNVSRKGQFCYAGAWTYVGDLAEGWIKQCYFNGADKKYDFFKDIAEPLPEKPVGCQCRHKYCVNADLFLALGALPGAFDEITSEKIRNRPEADWYSDQMRQFLSAKLYESNKPYSPLRKFLYAAECRASALASRIIKGVARRILLRKSIALTKSDCGR